MLTGLGELEIVSGSNVFIIFSVAPKNCVDIIFKFILFYFF